MSRIKALLAVGMILALAGQAGAAISLVYEEGPLTGQSPAVGQLLTFKVTDFDAGTTYVRPVIAGYSGLPAPFDGGGTAAGVTALDLLPGTVGAAGAQALGLYPGANGGLEDTWGVAKITRIQDDLGNAVWTPAGKAQEINLLFYGLQDFHIEPILDPVSGLDTGNDRINGVNFHIDMWSSKAPSTLLDASGGTGARLPGNLYPTVTNPPVANAILELALVSLPGFINAPGSGGGLASEFETRFNFTSLAGDGESWLEILGGASQALFDGDFHGFADAFAMNAANAAILGPLGFDLDCDMSAAFDTTPFVPATWLVTSDDPLKVRFFPEPVTMVALTLGVGGIGAYIRRRRLL